MARSPRSQPYRMLARFYDDLSPDTAAMNRHARRRTLGPLLRRLRSVCDLGCGTGTTALDFARRGWRVFAVDNSLTLCRIARRKARRARLSVRVLCADMRRFRLPEGVDLVTCEFAALNHVRRSDLDRVARAVARALRPGGYFLFDINTPKAFAEQIPAGHWIEQRGFKVVLHGGFDRQRQYAWLDFEWLLPHGKLYQHVRERIGHFCWSDAEIRRSLRRAGFGRIRAWDGVDVRPQHPQARRGYDIYYLAQKTPMGGKKR